MSGHSKWATTKHKKAVVDAKRGKLFAKLIKNVEVAARTGGGDPAGNPTLFDAIQKAKKSSVPNDNIDRAVKPRFRPGGRRRPVREHHLRGLRPRRRGGAGGVPDRQPQPRRVATSGSRSPATAARMADPGSVSYLFNRKGVIIVEKTKDLAEDDVLLAVLDAGAEEVNDLGDSFEVISEPTDLVAVRTALQDGRASTTSRPTRRSCRAVEIDLDEDQARKVFKMIDALEDSDDVQDVYANYNVSDEVMEKLG